MFGHGYGFVKQVRDSEFDKALKERETLIKNTVETEKKLAVTEALTRIEKEQPNLSYSTIKESLGEGLIGIPKSEIMP